MLYLARNRDGSTNPPVQHNAFSPIVTEYVDRPMLHTLSCKATISKTTRITEQSSSLCDHIHAVDTKHDNARGYPPLTFQIIRQPFTIKAAEVKTTSNDYTKGGEPIYYHGPHEMCIMAGGPQNQLILS